ncbi:unnamed protein product, partial [Brassica oleracea var. botrytis]
MKPTYYPSMHLEKHDDLLKEAHHTLSQELQKLRIIFNSEVLWRLKVPKNYGVDSGGKSWIPCYKRNLIRDVEPLIK